MTGRPSTARRYPTGPLFDAARMTGPELERAWSTARQTFRHADDRGGLTESPASIWTDWIPEELEAAMGGDA